MTVIEFQAWPKTPRLNRDITITEKIDGTNGAIIIEPLTDTQSWDGKGVPVTVGDSAFVVAAQSRNRLIAPGKSTDNAGFAGWVHQNAHYLAAILGGGRHYGEWWGQGIQRNYGLTEKRFSLFNTHRYGQLIELARSEGHVIPEGLGTVPVLYQGGFSEVAIQRAVCNLRDYGSVAEESFTGQAEGVIVYHSASKQVYKVLLENDHLSKGEAA